MRVSLTGVGAWGAGVSSAKDITATLHTQGNEPDQAVPIPRPELIPPRELRRSPAASRLGVEVAAQACAAAGQDPGNIRSVFTSSLGDSDITDYMCRTLAGTDKLLSPTRFHNSVHNAAAGSWSIACHNQAPASFVAAFENSAGMALFETLSLVLGDGEPTLLVAIDVPVPGALGDVHGVGTTAAVAMIIEVERDNTPVLDTRVDTAALCNTATDPACVTASLWPLLGAAATGSNWKGRLCVGAATALDVALEAKGVSA